MGSMIEWFIVLTNYYAISQTLGREEIVRSMIPVDIYKRILQIISRPSVSYHHGYKGIAGNACGRVNLEDSPASLY